MPYIKDENNRRSELRNGSIAKNAGELNFQIFTHVKYDKYSKEIAIKYIKDFLGDKPNYQKYNDMMGCIPLCCNEVERRLDKDIWDDFTDFFEKCILEINAYEDEKISENGDV